MSSRSATRSAALTLGGPVALVVIAGWLSVLFSESIELKFHNAFVVTAMAVGLYVFAGNSGVVSFGHVSFVAIGAFAAGMFSMNIQQKGAVFKELFPFIKDNQLGNIPTLLLATVLGGLFALDQRDPQFAQHRGDLRVVVVLLVGQRLRYLLADRP